MSDTIEKLHEACFTLTALVMDDRYAHMRKPLEMVIGGLVLPAIANLDPKQVDDDDLKNMEAYSAEKIAAWFAPKVVEAPAPAQVSEQVKALEDQDIVTAFTQSMPSATPATPTNPVTAFVQATTPMQSPRVQKPKATKVSQFYEGKNRRIKGGYRKPTKMARELECADRDIIYTWWNKNQRLMDKDSTECAQLAAECGRDLAPYQVAGCISQVARKALMSETSREGRIAYGLKHGWFTVRPVYSPELLKQVAVNYETARKDEEARVKAHIEILKQRGQV